MRISLHRILLVLLAGVFAIALVPAGVALDRRLSAELERKARDDLSMAPKILADRTATMSDALRMHAKDVAAGLAVAIGSGDTLRAAEQATAALVDPTEEVIILGPEGELWEGPRVGADLVRRVDQGEMPVGFFASGGRALMVALAPVAAGDVRLGAAGVGAVLDEAFAATLAGLTRSQVIVVARDGSVPAMAAADSLLAASVADSAYGWSRDGGVRTVAGLAGQTYWVIAAPLGEAGAVLFASDAAVSLAVLPALRRGALVAAGIALFLALLLAAVAAYVTVRPVRTLAHAADRLAEGDFGAPVERSVILELDTVSRAFGNMRQALANKLRELESANQELTDRQEKLRQLQAEMIQRDRLVATGRLVTELAHEIRNPVANVRNCLEVIRRGIDDDQLEQFTQLAIDELLRLHSLAEQMLDLNRPVDPDAVSCAPSRIVRQVVELIKTGADGGAYDISVEGSVREGAAIAPDALKQVLLNVLQNAREAMPDGGAVRLRLNSRDGIVELVVEDDGPGIPSEVLPKVFDPFFTTKGEVHGVGLGLFVAEGIVRRYGGRMTAANREVGRGASFRIELEAVASTEPAA
ncbi:MAG: ATP-binding protein [Gemmatimonadales bacterium]